MREEFATYKKTLISTLIIVGIIILGVSIVFGLVNGTIQSFFENFFEVISPITIGFIMAYLSNPVVNFLERRIFFWIPKFSLKRFVSIIATFIVWVLIIAFVCTMLIPNLISTIQSFWDTYIMNYESAVKMIAIRVNQIMDRFAFLDSAQRVDPDGLLEWFKNTFPWIDKLVEGDFSSIFPNGSGTDGSGSAGSSSIIDLEKIFSADNFMTIFGYVFSFGTSVVNILKNVILGIFIAIYMLISKEKFKAYLRRFLNSFLQPSQVRSIIRFGNLLDRSFGGFIEGQLLSTAIVGIMTYVLLAILGFSNPHLIATIIAITNVIPILGPFLGGVPAAFLVLLMQPDKTILFIILLIVIQQIDGNIICPNVLGDKVNISSLATLIAIVTMGGLFGVFGMLIGVPCFAVIIHLLNNYTINALRRKGFETELVHYYVGDPANISEKKKKAGNLKILTVVSNTTKKLLKKKKKDKEEKK